MVMIMDLQSDAFKGLESFQLSTYEVSVYSSLLMKGPMRASEITRESGIPQPRTYDILGKLQRKGLVIVNSSIQRTYEAVMPSKALRSRVQEMDRYLDSLDEYVLRNRKSSEIRAPNVWFVENSRSAMARLEDLISHADSEILFSLELGKLNDLLPALRRASKRGVTLCAVMKENIGKHNLDYLSELGVVRIREIMPVEIVIADRKTAFLNANSLSQTSNYSIFVQEEELVDVIDFYFFNMNWVSSHYYSDFEGMEKISVCSSWFACEAIENMTGKGYRVRAKVDGFRSMDPISIEGDVLSVKRIQGLQQAFFVKSGDETLSVGGKNATLEEIRMAKGTFNFIK